MKIGNLTLSGRVLLAPMAGVTDWAFRQICREQGAALTVTEMASTKALWFGDRKSPALLRLDENPAAAQIFGSDPETMAWGAQKALELSGCAVIDINMGCPAPKIVNNGDGAALMRDPARAAQIIAAVKRAVPVPVTVKFRLGWDANSRNYLEFAKMAEQAGADAVTVHGRTRAQQYEGTADWDAIAEVKAALRIPVIANGDASSPETAQALLRHTGAGWVTPGSSRAPMRCWRANLCRSAHRSRNVLPPPFGKLNLPPPIKGSISRFWKRAGMSTGTLKVCPD